MKEDVVYPEGGEKKREPAGGKSVALIYSHE